VEIERRHTVGRPKLKKINAPHTCQLEAHPVRRHHPILRSSDIPEHWPSRGCFSLTPTSTTLTASAGVASVRLVEIPDAVVRAALFPSADGPALPRGHPDRRIEVSGATVFLGQGLPDGMILPERVDSVELATFVQEVRERLRREDRQRAVWFVPEAAHPADLAARLLELGLKPADQPPFEPRAAAMAITQPPAEGPPNVDVYQVRTLEDLQAAWRVSANAFDVDAQLAAAFEARAEALWPFEERSDDRATFVATIDGEVVGAAGESFGKTAGYLGGSGTHQDHRGRGVYRSLVRARWDAAVAHGTPALTVTAGAMSRPILEGLGFTIVGWTDCLFDDLSA
jgi:GNAT superfamily N-acetyltransferase